LPPLLEIRDIYLARVRGERLDLAAIEARLGREVADFEAKVGRIEEAEPNAQSAALDSGLALGPARRESITTNETLEAERAAAQRTNLLTGCDGISRTRRAAS
jgi:hypothetical protein